MHRAARGAGIGVAVAESHPFAARTSVGVDDLADQQWVVGTNPDGAPELGPWPGPWTSPLPA